ncbi:hypothetical protein QWY84_12940 [Aquisalimonas lutea]|uniref:hypothetical protein n=1 Tax=Aquisalimonas lutea TaxID=1327750 RepID=UPI0025B49069|nr:hypothetical protein [Aquisalimonas lutea]MDN3518521.1 hypothetical protein [Aquisalimonas lutea]
MAAELADMQRFARYGEQDSSYLLAVITDEDQASRVELDDGQVAWQSTIRYDRLERKVDASTGEVRYEVRCIDPEQGGRFRLTSLIAEGERGAEFSELVRFGERLLTFDDRTGLVCEVRGRHQLVPRQILMTGRGDERFKGFKSEWATLKDDSLYVGSHGKTAEECWVKRLDRGYGLESLNWRTRYRRMREVLGVEGTPGYVIHEAAEWHPVYRHWYFFPRKISTEPFDEELDERERSGSQLIIADEAFDDVRAITIGQRVPERGVSSFKIIPGRPNECVGLKSVEWGAITETYMFCFDLDGNVLMNDTFIGAYKCEGVEVL